MTRQQRIIAQWKTRVALLNNDYRAVDGNWQRMRAITIERNRLIRAIKKYGMDKLIPV